MQSVVHDERSKNKELQLTLNYFQQLYKKEKDDKDDAQSAFNKVLGSLCISDQTSASNGGRRSEELAYINSPTFKLTNHFNEKITMKKSSKHALSKSNDRQIFAENKIPPHSSIHNAHLPHTSVNSPKMYIQKQHKSVTKYNDEKKKVRKTKSRK